MINFNEGFTICIDKPLEWTSFQVVKKVRYLTKAKKVGHAGTLDPLATGLLILCTGKHTKLIQNIQGQEKEYTGSFKLGCTTPSYDRETEEENFKEFEDIRLEQLNTVIQENLLGDVMQRPPIFSAVKIKGERAYEKARKGEDVKIEPKQVTISEFEITDYNPPQLDFRIVCSKGTYIRSIARDLGEMLGCGAYLTSLRRTRIGEHQIDDAYTIERFEQMVKTLKEA